MGGEFDGFFSEEEPQAVKRAKTKNSLECPVLFRDDCPNLNVIISEYFTEKLLEYLTAFFHAKGARVNIVYVFSAVFDGKMKINKIGRFFAENVRGDLREWLIPQFPVIAIGRALYAATYDTDIQTQGFYDGVFNDTFFYSPFLNNRVYPVDSFFKICAFGQADRKTGKPIHYWDRWEAHFAEKQIERALKAGNCSRARKKVVRFFEISEPNEWLRSRTDNIPENELWVAVDCETSGLNKLSDKIGDVALSFDGNTAYHLSWDKINPVIFSAFLKKHKCIGANFKFDSIFFAYHGCDIVSPAWDTMVAGHLLNEMRSNSLKTHAFVYTDHGGYDLELEKYKWKYPGLQNYLQIPDSVRISYACMDAAVTYQVWQAQARDMKREPELWDYYHSYCLPMLKVFIKAEYKGFCVDWCKVNEVGKMIQGKIKSALEAARAAFKNPSLDPNKKGELGKFLESRGWPCVNRNKSGGFKVSKNEFAEWEKMGYAEVKTLFEYSKWVTVWNTFIGADSDYGDDGGGDDFDGFEFYDDESEPFEGGDFFSRADKKAARRGATGLWQYKGVDNRIHTTFHPFMTKSHRHLSRGPNLQNIPKRNKEVSSIVRQCYIPPDIAPCKKEEADQIWVFDRLDGLTLNKPDDMVEIGMGERVKAPAKDLFKYAPEVYGYRLEYYKKCEKGEWFIVETDGYNLQAMIAASMSRDKNLCDVFLTGGDFHNNNTYHILAKYRLFDECKITMSDNTVIRGMEWEQIPSVLRSGREVKDVYLRDIQKGDIAGGSAAASVEKTGRHITYEEFCANAKKGKCKELRDIGKMIGLSFIFGASAGNLAGGTLRMAWDPKMCADFIRERGLADLRSRIVQNNKRLRGDELSYFTVASFFRAEFFKLYPDLEKWIFECAQTASAAGYRRSPWGSRRLLPQLTTKGAHADGGMYKNLCNISVNSPVQDYETAVMSQAMIKMDAAFEELGYLSYIVGTVHDSVVTINHASELESCLRIALEAFQLDHPAATGLPYSGECNVADYTKGEFWGFGHREVVYEDVKGSPIIRKRYRVR